ncbi:MAG: right-handed parallel beta-helix repeat-containing protein [Deltaproteobacteria bacterium]|nr:right-handed parallel beta-helix repeat-containing protein [Deltaproteobacteria bacterium]
MKVKHFWIFLGLWLMGSVVYAEPNTQGPQSTYYDGFFTKETLTVTSEDDGFKPGTLRTVLLAVNTLRNQNPFKLVSIQFADHVHRIVLKFPLPEIEASLITLDCQLKDRKVLIDGSELIDSSGLVVTGNRATIQNCHLTGFDKAALALHGHHNTIQHNIIGYLPGSYKETHVSYYGTPKTNSGIGILLEDGASENSIVNNELIANQKGAILLQSSAGSQNKISHNLFAENRGLPIHDSSAYSAIIPKIEKFQKNSESFSLEGRVSPLAKVELYLVGKNDQHIAQKLSETQANATGKFVTSGSWSSLIPGQSKVVAISHDSRANTSIFSNATLYTESTVPNKLAETSLENPSTTDKSPAISDAIPVKSSPKPSIEPEEETYFDTQGKGTPSTEPDVDNPNALIELGN